MRAVLWKAGLTRLAATGAALLAGAATLLAGPAPAHAQTVFIEVNPSTIMAGFTVSIRGSCGSMANPAKATSEAFGTVTLEPENNFLVGQATVPANKQPRGYTVRMTCASGASANTTLWVISATSRPTRGPNTGGGYLANHRGPGGTIMIAGGLAAASAGGVLAVWLFRRRRAGEHRQ
jgi:hypothetical protein